MRKDGRVGTASCTMSVPGETASSISQAARRMCQSLVTSRTVCKLFAAIHRAASLALVRVSDRKSVV